MLQIPSGHLSNELDVVYNNANISQLRSLTLGCAYIGALVGVFPGTHMMHQVLLMMNKMIA